MFSSLPEPKYSKQEPTFSLSKKPIASKSNKTITNFKDASTIVKKTLPSGDVDLYIDANGTLDYNLTIASISHENVQASYQDTIPLKKKYPNLKHKFPRYNLQTCPDDTLANIVSDTKSVIDKLLNNNSDNNSTDVNYVTYSSNNVVSSGNDERIIQIHTLKQDPLLPPKFKLRKNRHQDLPPPAPIIKNTTSESKLTQEDKAKWNIPAAISNWKNNQGFTIALDKRVLAANGGNSDAGIPEINAQGFGDLSKALESADKQAREEIKIRNEALKLKAAQDLQQKELQLRQLAEMTRIEREKKRSHNDFHDNKRQKPN